MKQWLYYAMPEFSFPQNEVFQFRHKTMNADADTDDLDTQY